MRPRIATLAIALVLTLVGWSAASASDDPDLSKQWGLNQIGALDAWSFTTGEAVRIGIVDTGVDLAHEDLAGKVVAHASCVGSGGDPALCQGSGQDDNGHGTHVAGIAAAVNGNGVGVSGVAPEAELVVAKVLSAAGAGSSEDISAGIKWVVDNGAKVVNLSLGDPLFIYTTLFGTDMRPAIEYAWAHGAVPVVASGNSNLLGLGIGSSNYGDLDAIIVGAVGPDGTEASYSSPMGNAKWPLMAPGGAGDGGAESDIWSTFWVKGQENSYAALAGTSMAAPHVAGAVALLLAEGYTPAQAVQRLLDTADAGRLNVARAVS